MINHLSSIEVSNRRIFIRILGSTHGGIEWSQVVGHTVVFTRFWLYRREPTPLNPVRNWLPFEIEHRMHRLYLDPPTSFLQCFTNKPTIITMHHNKFVAVFDICILKRYFTLNFLLTVKVKIQTSWFSFLLLVDKLSGHSILAVYELHQLLNTSRILLSVLQMGKQCVQMVRILLLDRLLMTTLIFCV